MFRHAMIAAVAPIGCSWLKSNRPYYLRVNLARYDAALQLWISRIDRVRSAQRQWSNTQNIPPPPISASPHPQPRQQH